MSTFDDDGEWERQQQEYEAHVEQLSASLRTCAIHGNPAAIDKGYEGELSILADPCGCWSESQYYTSIDECVEAWNKQPQIDALTQRIATLAADNARLRETLAFAAQYKGFEARACPLCTYENGKFVERCQMHTDMDNLRAALDEARAWVPIEVATFSTDYETLAIADNELSIISGSGDDIETIGFTLPKSYRVCQRRAPSAGEVVDGE